MSGIVAIRVARGSVAPLRWEGPWTRFLFFAGKGGVGKTTVASGVALRLASEGKSVLLVSTDPASNLDDVFEMTAGSEPTAVPGADRLRVMNVDPEAAATSYRQRVLAPLRGTVPEVELRGIEEQLSGQCTVEIAAFDEFARLLTDERLTAAYAHVLFDTAPTGHTLRLLALPSAWSDYIETNPEGASCLGPLAGLSAKRDQYERTVRALHDRAQTTVLLVAQPNRWALREAARAAGELVDLGIANQQLILNGILSDALAGDEIAESFANRQDAALAAMPEQLASLPAAGVPLVGWELTGREAIDALTRLEHDDRQGPREVTSPKAVELAAAGVDALIDELAAAGHGVVMVMGKGGVGKTTIATSLALGLARRGHDVHLSTTDPAGRLPELPAEHPRTLTVSRIDPAAELRRYTEEKLDRAAGQDAQRRALLEEDLRSPCTEELAVFQAFSQLLVRGRTGFTVIDTAPTGHTLLLLDRTGAYHRDVLRNLTGPHGQVTTPLMRIQDPNFTRVLIVTLAEATPVQEAAALQEDLRRAGIEPYGWVINASLAASGTRDPVLRARARLELPQLRRVRERLASRVWLVPWQVESAIGQERLAGQRKA